ncbi:hypothetical protein [Nostoc sp. NMS4]|uniref:hypothetical protein n=1 Tax=Nostoc sp. NMS4 TaxID=2815390 RepID=UPI0025FA19E1|nr:hypothetical protein [Nostoc sp. NMS4]MBN3925381.1 hypothetical protein [Nostoc sp. NMS4]
MSTTGVAAAPNQTSYMSDRILSENGQCVNIHPNMILGDRIIFLHCHYKNFEYDAIARSSTFIHE